MIKLMKPAIPNLIAGRARKRENAVLLCNLGGGVLLIRIIPEG
jgi:hypothetical protein